MHSSFILSSVRLRSYRSVLLFSVCPLELNYSSTRSQLLLPRNELRVSIRHYVPTLHLDVEAFDCSSLAYVLVEDNKKLTVTTREKEKTPRMFCSVARDSCKLKLTTNPSDDRRETSLNCSRQLVCAKQELHSNLVRNDWLFWVNVTDQMQCFRVV